MCYAKAAPRNAEPPPAPHQPAPKRPGGGSALVWSLLAAASLVVAVGTSEWNKSSRWTTLAKYIAPGDIVMYAYDGCEPAEAAREHFRKYQIAYAECDVRANAQCHRQWQALKVDGVPAFLIYGKDVQLGFNKDALYKALVRKRMD